MQAARNLLHRITLFFHCEHPKEAASPTSGMDDLEKYLEESDIPARAITITPSNMKPEDAAELGKLLSTCIEQKQYFLKPGLNKIMLGTGENRVQVFLSLPCGLSYRKSESNPLEDRWDIVVDKAIAAGKYSHIYLCNGTLLPEADGSVSYKPLEEDKDKKTVWLRVLKEQVHSQLSFHPTERVFNEYRFGKMTPFIGGKYPVVLDTDPPVSYYVENYLGGEDLLELLINERTNKDQALSLAEREELMLEVLYAVKQLHDLGIMHRDIKPDNFIAFKHNGRFIVIAIDLGLSKLIKDPDLREILGTPGYVAPEVYEKAGKVTVKSDIYSLGILGGIIFGADQPAVIELDEKGRINLKEALKMAKNYRFIRLFNGVKGFVGAGVECPRVKTENLLYKMISNDPDERPGLNETIEEYEKVVFERRKLALPASKRDSFTSAHKAAMQLRNELENTRDVTRKLAAHAKQGWGALLDSPENLREFVRVLRIAAIYNVKDPKELCEKIERALKLYDETYDRVTKNVEKIIALYNSQEEHPHDVKFYTERVLSNCRYIKAKCSASRLTLDEMEVLTYKLNKRIARTEAHLGYLQRKMPIAEQPAVCLK